MIFLYFCRDDFFPSVIIHCTFVAFNLARYTLVPSWTAHQTFRSTKTHHVLPSSTKFAHRGWVRFRSISSFPTGAAKSLDVIFARRAFRAGRRTFTAIRRIPNGACFAVQRFGGIGKEGRSTFHAFRTAPIVLIRPGLAGQAIRQPWITNVITRRAIGASIGAKRPTVFQISTGQAIHTTGFGRGTAHRTAVPTRFAIGTSTFFHRSGRRGPTSFGAQFAGHTGHFNTSSQIGL